MSLSEPFSPADLASAGRVIETLRTESKDRTGEPLGGLFHDLAVEVEDLRDGYNEHEERLTVGHPIWAGLGPAGSADGLWSEVEKLTEHEVRCALFAAEANAELMERARGSVKDTSGPNWLDGWQPSPRQRAWLDGRGIEAVA